VTRRISRGFVVEQNNATGGVSFRERQLNHSVADRNGVSLADYIHAIYGFIRQAKCREILMIGCGGGTLATMLHRAGVKVVIADTDRQAFEIARQYFHMPEEIECHVGDGRDFLQHGKRHYDAIVLDAYADGKIPRHLLTARFFALAKSRLRIRKSLFLVNLLVRDDDDRLPDRIAWRLSAIWRQVRLLDAEGWDDRNAVAVAGSASVLVAPRLRMRPKTGVRKLTDELNRLHFRPLRP
jgi:SAM-dependent methyltransferase